MKFGKVMKRKVVELGKKYYWNTDDTTIDIPFCLGAYLLRNGINVDENTSVLINYYLDNSTIGKHCDKTKGLKPGSVIHSISFTDSNWANGISNGEIGRITFDKHGHFQIMNNSMFTWSPFEHETAGIKHWTSHLARHHCADRGAKQINRINITVRQLE